MQRLAIGDRVEYWSQPDGSAGTVFRIVLPEEPQIVEIEIARCCGGPPLLVTVAASTLVKRSELSITLLAAELARGSVDSIAPQ
jgi:hypothetical protein